MLYAPIFLINMIISDNTEITIKQAIMYMESSKL